jgi:dihydrodipicolinate synthase/N-acetylneuraminate lyase
MILPPYVYIGDWRETRAHMQAILEATPLSCMLYNNPIAYKTDFLPEQVRELAETHGNLNAVKESSTDVRRASAIRALLGDRMAICVGVDDAIVEGIAAGATGWVAGLVNAFPAESVELFDLATAGRHEEAFAALVPAAAPHGYGAEVRPAHQVGAGRGRCRQRACPRTAAHHHRHRA